MSLKTRVAKLEDVSQAVNERPVRFFIALINFAGEETFEESGAEWGPMCFGWEHVAEFAQTAHVVFIFDPARSDHSEHVRFVGPEEYFKHFEDTSPAIVVDNLYPFEDVHEGFFAERVKLYSARN